MFFGCSPCCGACDSCTHFIHTPIDDGSVQSISASVAGESLSVSLPDLGSDKGPFVEVGTPQLVTVRNENPRNFDDFFTTFVRIGFWEPVPTAELYVDEEGCEHWTVSLEIEAESRFIDTFRTVKRRGIVVAIDCQKTTFSADFSNSSWELIEDQLLDPSFYDDFPGTYEQLLSLVQTFESSLGDPTASVVLPSCIDQC